MLNLTGSDLHALNGENRIRQVSSIKLSIIAFATCIRAIIKLVLNFTVPCMLLSFIDIRPSLEKLEFLSSIAQGPSLRKCKVLMSYGTLQVSFIPLTVQIIKESG